LYILFAIGILYRDINITHYILSPLLFSISTYTYINATIQIKHIQTFRFDDGDVIDNLEDAYIFNKEDYLLTIRLEKSKKKEWIGVRNVVDEETSDVWARSVGWYVANINGEELCFSLLSDALRAYDAHVMQSSHHNHTDNKKSQLNLPEEWEDTFEEG